MYSPLLMRPADFEATPSPPRYGLGRSIRYSTPPELIRYALTGATVPRFISGLGRGGGSGAHSSLRGLGRGGGGGAGAHAALRGFDDFGAARGGGARGGRGGVHGFGSHGPVMAQRVHGFGRPYAMVHGFGDFGAARGGGARGGHGGVHGFGAARGGGARGGRGGVHGLHDFGFMVDGGPRAPWFTGTGLGQDDLTPVDVAPSVDYSSLVTDVPTTLDVAPLPTDVTTAADVTASGAPDTWGTFSPTDFFKTATSALQTAATAASAVLPYFGVTPKRPTPPAGYAYSTTGQLVRIAPTGAAGLFAPGSTTRTPLLILGGLAVVGGIAYFALK